MGGKWKERRLLTYTYRKVRSIFRWTQINLEEPSQDDISETSEWVLFYYYYWDGGVGPKFSPRWVRPRQVGIEERETSCSDEEKQICVMREKKKRTPTPWHEDQLGKGTSNQTCKPTPWVEWAQELDRKRRPELVFLSWERRARDARESVWERLTLGTNEWHDGSKKWKDWIYNQNGYLSTKKIPRTSALGNTMVCGWCA